jgi:hypothetical protein
MEISNKAAVCTGELAGCADNSDKNIFDYFVFSIVDFGVNYDLLRPGALVVTHSRKLSATLGGSTSTRP